MRWPRIAALAAAALTAPVVTAAQTGADSPSSFTRSREAGVTVLRGSVPAAPKPDDAGAPDPAADTDSKNAGPQASAFIYRRYPAGAIFIVKRKPHAPARTRQQGIQQAR